MRLRESLGHKPMLDRLAARHRLAIPALCLAVSLTVGLLLGLDAAQTGVHDFRQIVSVSLSISGATSLSELMTALPDPVTSPGRHLPYVLLFWLTSPDSLAAAQYQGAILTWLIGFGFVPMAAYVAGEAFNDGYGPYVMAADVVLRVLPWSAYTDAQPQYTLAAGFGLLCLAVLFRADEPATVRGLGIGTTAAASTWVRPVAGLLVTTVAASLLLDDRDIRALGVAALAGLVACLPLLLLPGGSSRFALELWHRTWAGVIVQYPNTIIRVLVLEQPAILFTALIAALAVWVSDRRDVAVIGTLTAVTAAMPREYLPHMSLALFVPLLTAVLLLRLRSAEWPATPSGTTDSAPVTDGRGGRE